jgi:hypothetical protein
LLDWFLEILLPFPKEKKKTFLRDDLMDLDCCWLVCGVLNRLGFLDVGVESGSGMGSGSGGPEGGFGVDWGQGPCNLCMVGGKEVREGAGRERGEGKEGRRGLEGKDGREGKGGRERRDSEGETGGDRGNTAPWRGVSEYGSRDDVSQTTISTANYVPPAEASSATFFENEKREKLRRALEEVAYCTKSRTLRHACLCGSVLSAVVCGEGEAVIGLLTGLMKASSSRPVR